MEKYFLVDKGKVCVNIELYKQLQYKLRKWAKGRQFRQLEIY